MINNLKEAIMEKENNNTPSLMLVKASGTSMSNHMLWLDAMDKLSIENNDVDNYWVKNIVPEFGIPVYEEPVLDNAGEQVVRDGRAIFRPVAEYSSAAVGLHLWKKDMNRVEHNK